MKNIINNYSSYIKAIIKNKLGYENRDLEQEVYIKIWQNMNKFNNTKGNLKNWLSTITQNICIDYFRKKDTKNLSQNLNGCNKVLLFAATIGIEIDRLITKYSHISPTKSLIFQAKCAKII